MTDWWRALEEELEHRGIDAPDPWASVGVASEQTELTPEQRAFLDQVAEQGPDDDLLANDPIANDAYIEDGPES